MRGPWVRRKAFTIKFRGRQPRALLWKKSVYKAWFEFAKCSPLGYPKEFGDLSSFKNFEEWWKHPDYGFELFCEPVEKPLVEVVSNFNDIDNHYLYLKVDMHSDFHICMERIKSLFIKKGMNRSKPQKLKSMATFKPSKEMMRIHVKTLNRQRKAWALRQIGYTRKKVGDLLDYRFQEQENLLRAVSRDVQRANAVFKNISKGTFP